jgi:hypothetical protein
MELKEAGIAPEKVHFISLGVQHGIKGVIEDFTIFPVDELLDLCRHRRHLPGSMSGSMSSYG